MKICEAQKWVAEDWQNKSKPVKNLK